MLVHVAMDTCVIVDGRHAANLFKSRHGGSIGGERRERETTDPVV